jgi:hypothetical protein
LELKNLKALLSSLSIFTLVFVFSLSVNASSKNVISVQSENAFTSFYYSFMTDFCNDLKDIDLTKITLDSELAKISEITLRRSCDFNEESFSDFDQNLISAINNFRSIETLVSDLEDTKQKNTKAYKFLLENKSILARNTTISSLVKTPKIRITAK